MSRFPTRQPRREMGSRRGPAEIGFGGGYQLHPAMGWAAYREIPAETSREIEMWLHATCCRKTVRGATSIRKAVCFQCRARGNNQAGREWGRVNDGRYREISLVSEWRQVRFRTGGFRTGEFRTGAVRTGGLGRFHGKHRFSGSGLFGNNFGTDRPGVLTSAAQGGYRAGGSGDVIPVQLPSATTRCQVPGAK